MRVAIVLSALAAAVMFALIGRGLLLGDFWEEGGVLYSLAWGKVTLADLYVGFGLFSGWVIFREASVARSVVCVALVMTLGNAFAAVYVLVALLTCGGSWSSFWLAT